MSSVVKTTELFLGLIYTKNIFGPLADKLIRSGMYVEHNLGRYHTRELVKGLDLYEEERSTVAKLVC